MCSRFEMTAPAEEVARLFRVTVPPLPDGRDIRPTDPALAITHDGARLLRFGLAAPWDGRPLINARSETVADKPAFRAALAHRCLAPATAWLEWRTAPGGKRRNRIGAADGTLLAFAALSDGVGFAILTCPPVAAIAHVHDRMPVALHPDAWEGWLEPDRPFAEVAPLLAPREDVQATEEQPRQPDLFG